METQRFLFKSYPQHKFWNIIKSKWLILDNYHCQLNSELWLHWGLHILYMYMYNVYIMFHSIVR